MKYERLDDAGKPFDLINWKTLTTWLKYGIQKK